MVEAINQPIPTLPDNTDPTLVLSVLNSETQEGEDYSANGNDAVTVTDVRFNDEGGIFNGSTSEIDLPAGDVLITDKDNFSISGRFKADTIAAGANSQRIITIFRSGGGSGFSIATGNNNQLQLLYRSGADAFVTVVMATISTGQWYTFFVTNNGTSIISYVDNETPITTTDTILGVDNTPVQMGSAGGAAFFDGMIDEVNIHSVPKPADHVSEQFKKGVPDSSLVLHVTDGTIDHSRFRQVLTNNGAVVGKRVYYDGSSSIQKTQTIVSAGAWTVNMWINPDIVAAIVNLISGTAPTANSVCQYLGFHSSGKLAFWDNDGAAWRLANTVLSTSKWQMVTFSCAGSTVVKFHVNGEPDGTGAIGAALNDLYIRRLGVFTDGATRNYTGYQDDVKAFSEEKSDGDIKQYYEMTKGLY